MRESDDGGQAAEDLLASLSEALRAIDVKYRALAASGVDIKRTLSLYGVVTDDNAELLARAFAYLRIVEDCANDSEAMSEIVRMGVEEANSRIALLLEAFEGECSEMPNQESACVPAVRKCNGSPNGKLLH